MVTVSSGFIADARSESGGAPRRTCKLKRSRTSRLAGTSTSWTPPLFVRISTSPMPGVMVPCPRRPRRARSLAPVNMRRRRSQNGFLTKLHLRAEGNRRPITVVLTKGERNEQIVLEAVLDQGDPLSGTCCPCQRPRSAAGDKAYSKPIRPTSAYANATSDRRSQQGRTSVTSPTSTTGIE